METTALRGLSFYDLNDNCSCIMVLKYLAKAWFPTLFSITGLYSFGSEKNVSISNVHHKAVSIILQSVKLFQRMTPD